MKSQTKSPITLKCRVAGRFTLSMIDSMNQVLKVMKSDAGYVMLESRKHAMHDPVHVHCLLHMYSC